MGGYLQEWLQYLGDPSVPPGRQFMKLLGKIPELRVSQFQAAGLAAMSAVDFACAASLPEAVFHVRMMLGTLSGMGAMLAFQPSWKGVLFESLHKLSAVTAELNRTLGHTPRFKAGVNLWVTRARRRVFLCRVYGWFVLAGSMFTLLFEEQHWADFVVPWLSPEAGDDALYWAHRISGFLMMTGSPTLIISLIFFTLPFLLDVHQILALSQRQINYLLEAAPCTAKVARLHSELLDAKLVLDRVLGPLVPAYLLGALVLPLLSTVEIVLKGRDSDPYALALAPAVLFAFVPMCEAGDDLAGARQALAHSAYAGPWLEERRDQFHRRLVLMAASGMRGSALFRGRGWGSLHRRRCFSAMRIWSNFLQTLLNARLTSSS